MVSVDALQEFRISTSSFAPEFGRTPGGQISLVSRGGTNAFHGDVFDYFRNTVLDANDWFLKCNGQGSRRRAAERFWRRGRRTGHQEQTVLFRSYEGLRLQAPSPLP